MPANSINIGLTEVSTTQALPLGFLFEENSTENSNGPRIWEYIQNGEASSSMTIGMLVRRKASTTTGIGTISATTAVPVHAYIGVAQFTIPAASYGFVLKRGYGSVLADTGNIAANTALVVGNAVAGAFDGDATATTVPAFGWAPTAITAAATGLAWINIQG